MSSHQSSQLGHSNRTRSILRTRLCYLHVLCNNILCSSIVHCGFVDNEVKNRLKFYSRELLTLLNFDLVSEE